MLNFYKADIKTILELCSSDDVQPYPILKQNKRLDVNSFGES